MKCTPFFPYEILNTQSFYILLRVFRKRFLPKKGFKYTNLLYAFMEMKQAIIIRTDLKMSPGKIATQAAHAAVSSAFLTKAKKRSWFLKWDSEGQRKIVLKVKDLKALKELKKKASSLGIPTKIIKDAGLTEILPGSVTALGIGPAPEEKVNKVIGSLPLL